MYKRFTFFFLSCTTLLFSEYQPQNILVTGGCGFIGSNFINEIGNDFDVVCLDKMDYCARKEHVCVPCKIYAGNINDRDLVKVILEENHIDTVVHFAAQSHVDNSFGNSISFTIDNILGTHSLIETCREYRGVKRFIHISTDEVYGEVSSTETSFENSLLNPSNPYAATKAGAEFIVKSYYHSYQFPVIITRGNNVYGPNQYPEKLIPRFITHLLTGKKCPIQGSGEAQRHFIYVSDVVEAVKTILFHGKLGEIYNIGSLDEYSVNEIYAILLNKIKPGASLDEWKITVADRNFNDKRYNVDAAKLRQLGWKEKMDFNTGLDKVIEWYRQNYTLYIQGNLPSAQTL